MKYSDPVRRFLEINTVLTLIIGLIQGFILGISLAKLWISPNSLYSVFATFWVGLTFLFTAYSVWSLSTQNMKWIWDMVKIEIICVITGIVYISAIIILYFIFLFSGVLPLGYFFYDSGFQFYFQHQGEIFGGPLNLLTMCLLGLLLFVLIRTYRQYWGTAN